MSLYITITNKTSQLIEVQLIREDGKAVATAVDTTLSGALRLLADEVRQTGDSNAERNPE